MYEARVYNVCMARVNVYLPDELAARARELGLNVSAVTRSALEAELAGRAASEWLAHVARLPSPGIEHDHVLAALDAAREELAGRDGG
jgi:post-segregation antitoxin (ccd killing protein)